MFASEVFWSNARKRCLSSPPDQKPPIGEAVITGSLRGQSTTARDLMTVRTAYWPSLCRSHQSVFMRVRRVRLKSGSRFDGVLHHQNR